MPKEPQPNLKLSSQEKPPQKISINNMPLSIHQALEERANKVQRKVSTYCRVVLEHAVTHQADYEGPLNGRYPASPAHNAPVHIPVKDKDFMKELYAWGPFGLSKRTEIALSILKKHLEVRSW
jgi:hypothetical protein